MSEAVEQRRGEFLVAEDLHSLAEREVGRDGRRALLVAVGEEVEQQLAAGALEGTKPSSSTISSATRR